MKWPRQQVIIRHARSQYNALKDQKNSSELYQEFKHEFNLTPDSKKTKKLAKEVQKTFALNVSDRQTPLTAEGCEQALLTGKALSTVMEKPNVIICSPYLRTRQTLEKLIESWPTLGDVKVYYEERIRELDHGRALLYNDWRVFQALNPKERKLYQLLGPYDYRFPNGENVPDVRLRVHDEQATITREFSGQIVWEICHHLTLLAKRANQERLGPEEFQELDTNSKPVNCGVTVYEGKADRGKAGHLVLAEYNIQHY